MGGVPKHLRPWAIGRLVRPSLGAGLRKEAFRHAANTADGGVARGHRPDPLWSDRGPISGRDPESPGRIVRATRGGCCEAPMAERFDVVVVGARCAGSPLAALLARQGLRVAVLERTTFPRDTLSTHMFQAQALVYLERLGVSEKLRATGSLPCRISGNPCVRGTEHHQLG